MEKNKQEFNLSEKMWISPLSEQPLYHEKDIKEFIKRLKEEIDGCEYKDVHIAIIDKLAGDKLVEAKD